MSGKFVTRWFYASLESSTRPAGLFGNKVEVVHNQKVVNFDEYATHLQKCTKILMKPVTTLSMLYQSRWGNPSRALKQTVTTWVMSDSRSPAAR